MASLVAHHLVTTKFLPSFTSWLVISPRDTQSCQPELLNRFSIHRPPTNAGNSCNLSRGEEGAARTSPGHLGCTPPRSVYTPTKALLSAPRGHTSLRGPRAQTSCGKPRHAPMPDSPRDSAPSWPSAAQPQFSQFSCFGGQSTPRMASAVCSEVVWRH